VMAEGVAMTVAGIVLTVAVIIGIVTVYRYLHMAHKELTTDFVWDHIEGQFRRGHSFQWPWDPMQVALLFLFAFDEALFYGLFLSGMEGDTATYSFIIHSVLTLVVVVLWVRMSFWDVARLSITHAAVASKPAEEDPHGLKWCRKCNSIFPGTKRKHCRRCNKCVCGFDHHCWFLNTCIGADNRLFFIAICYAFLALTIFELVVGGVAAHVWFVEEDYFTAGDVIGFRYATLKRDVVDRTGEGAFLLWVFLEQFVVGAGVVGLLMLTGFHMYLVATSSATIQWFKVPYADHLEPWMEAKALFLGAIVETTEEIDTCNQPVVRLPKGSVGEVVEVDAEGDALIRFAEFDQDQWVKRESFDKLQIRQEQTSSAENACKEAAPVTEHFPPSVGKKVEIEMAEDTGSGSLITSQDRATGWHTAPLSFS